MNMDFSALKYCKVITEKDPRLDIPGFAHEIPLQLDGIRKDIMFLDEKIAPGFFLNEYMWHMPGQAIPQRDADLALAAPHVSSYDKVISFVGTNPDNLYDLCGEVEILLENHRFVLDRHFAVYIPAGMCHSVTVRRVDRPIWQYVVGHGKRFDATPCEIPGSGSGRDLAKLFAYSYGQGFELPDYRKGGGPRDEPGRHDHITLMDEEMVPGAEFYIEASWMGTAPRKPLPPDVKIPGPKRHIHPFPELITYFGTNWDDPYDLQGHVYLTLEDQPFDITKSFVAYIPEDVPHCPLYLEEKLDHRIVPFTAGPAKKYI